MTDMSETTTAFTKDQLWMRQYDKLVAYKETNGDTLVPAQYDLDKPLGTWVRGQRALNKAGKLPLARKQCLDQIGFVWKIRGSSRSSWMENYEKLILYKAQHGDTQIPAFYSDRSLALWVKNMRRLNASGSLPEDRRKLLNDIDFVWKVTKRAKKQTPPSAWMEKYEKLILYKEEHGDTQVPTFYAADKSLALWVRSMRRLNASGSLPEDRRKLLDDIDFVWKVTKHKRSAKQQSWMENYEKLVLYKEEHGDTQVPTFYAADQSLAFWVKNMRRLHAIGSLPEDRKKLLNDIDFVWKVTKRAKKQTTTSQESIIHDNDVSRDMLESNNQRTQKNTNEKHQTAACQKYSSCNGFDYLVLAASVMASSCGHKRKAITTAEVELQLDHQQMRKKRKIL